MSHWVKVIVEDATSVAGEMPAYVVQGLNRIVHLMEVSAVFHFRTDDLESIAGSISECTDLTELSQLLYRAATLCGFDHFSLFVSSQGDSTTFSTRMCTSLNREWLMQYLEKSYQFMDPVLHRASEQDGAFLFSDLSYSCPLVGEFWSAAESHGIGRNGFCHALTRRDGARLAVSFMTASNADITRDIVRLNRSDLCEITSLAIECFCRVALNEPYDQEGLSASELQYLHMISTSPDPEKSLFLEPHCSSGEDLQNSIRRKLNVTTIFQAVSIANAKRLFEGLPYYSEEIIAPFSEAFSLNTDLKEEIDPNELHP